MPAWLRILRIAMQLCSYAAPSHAGDVVKYEPMRWAVWRGRVSIFKQAAKEKGKKYVSALTKPVIGGVFDAGFLNCKKRI